MKKFTVIVLMTLMFLSCNIQHSYLPATIENMTPITKVPVQLSPSITNMPLPMPPKIKSIDWKATLSPMIDQILSLEDINKGSVLLVNTFNNSTYSNVKVDEATPILIKLLENNSKFNLISIDALNAARKRLGLSAFDRLESLSKVLGLARYLKAQYVLYSTAIDGVETPKLDLKLMLVKTGEIIWSGYSTIY